MSTTFLIRHAQTTFSEAFRVNGDPAVPVALTPAGQAACRDLRDSIGPVGSCVASGFGRCVETADLLTGGRVDVVVDRRLGELDYGVFEGGPFLDYAHWLAEHGPWARPPRAGESQAEGIARMATGLLAVLDHLGPRLVVAHGLLSSVIAWVGEHRGERLTEVFLPAAPYLDPLVLQDDDLRTRCLGLLDHAKSTGSTWRADLGVFPVRFRAGLATVSARAVRAITHGHTNEEAADA